MRFFLIGQHRETGDVSPVSQATYGTRQEALDDLSAALPADGSLTGYDLFVVDLDAATPVVVYQAPLALPVDAPVEEPIADVWEAPAAVVDALAEIVAVEEAALEGPPPVWGVPAGPEPVDAADEKAVMQTAIEHVSTAEAAPQEAETFELPSATRTAADELEAAIAEAPVASVGLLVDDEPDPAPADVYSQAVEPDPSPEVPELESPPLELAEALRRAASQMESEGVVPAPEVEELIAYSPLSSILVADEAEPVAPSDSGSEPDSAPASWPWEEAAVPEDEEPAVASAAISEVESEPMGLLPSFTAVGIDEPGLEDITLLTPSDAEDLFDVRPVIMGEYPDETGISLDASDPPETQADIAPTSVPEPPFAAEVELVAADAPPSVPVVEDAAVEEPAGPSDPAYGDVAAASAAAYESAQAASAAGLGAYEPGGLDIATYDCKDCVYVDTCPKANQDGPATCGSFQWKSV
jgi:hypothetical protein